MTNWLNQTDYGQLDSPALVTSSKANDEMEDLLKDQIANGNIEIIPQDTPTNNSPESTPFLTDHGKRPVQFLKNAAQKERGDIQKDSDYSASELLAEALDIDESITNEISGAADGAFEDAKAMLKVIGPALFDDFLDGKTFIHGASENDIIDVMAEIISARGILPAIRAGKNAYGIATVTNSKEFKPHIKATEKEKDILDIFKSYAVVGKIFGAVHADRVTPRILPSDANASSKIETILKANRMSNRLDVAKVGSSKTEAVGCPYISGSKSNLKPEVYLESLRSTALPFLADPTDSDASALGASVVVALASSLAGSSSAGAPFNSAEISSPSSPIIAKRESTFAVSPSAIPICSNVPSLKDSNSIVALSVSISAKISPSSTLSPTFFNHVATVPSSMVSLRRGILITSAIVYNLCGIYG